MLSIDALNIYKFHTFHLQQRLSNQDQAVDFVNQRGFIYFWPIRDITLPSLWVAAAGDRPVADAHDDPGHVTWGWKDNLLGKRRWYYAKVLRGKATIISNAAVPYFYALSENYGSPEEDYLTIYEQGRLTQEARAVYEALLEHGPLDTVALRKAAHLTSQTSDSRFNKALTDLQADFKIVPVGITDSGAWHYAFAYEIAPRYYPELIEASRFIGELQAREKLAELYFLSVGAAQVRDLTMLFGWTTAQANQAIDRLVARSILHRNQELSLRAGEWIALNELAEKIHS